MMNCMVWELYINKIVYTKGGTTFLSVFEFYLSPIRLKMSPYVSFLDVFLFLKVCANLNNIF